MEAVSIARVAGWMTACYVIHINSIVAVWLGHPHTEESGSWKEGGGAHGVLYNTRTAFIHQKRRVRKRKAN